MPTTRPNRNSASNHPKTSAGLPWHWLLGAVALLAALLGAWTLWGPMPIARNLPPAGPELFRLKQVVDAPDLKAFQHRQVNLLGRYTGHKVVIEGDMGGRSGFYVLSPFAERSKSYVDGSETGLTVLVQRGWVPTRAKAEIVMTAMHDQLIQGRLAFPSLGDAAKAERDTGLVRSNLSLQAYASEIGMPLLAMVVLQEPGADWSEKDIRQDTYQRRWPELYPQDRNIVRNGWALLSLSVALAGLGIWVRPKRAAGDRAAFADTVPDTEAEPAQPTLRKTMIKAKILIPIVIVLVVAASVFLHYRNELARLKRVEIGSTPFEQGSLAKLIFRNSSSSKIEFPLRCFYGLRRPGEKVLFESAIVLPPHGSLEFDVNPELGGRVPEIIREKACEATWRGPFGMQRSAWWVRWHYRNPARKVEIPD